MNIDHDNVFDKIMTEGKACVDYVSTTENKNMCNKYITLVLCFLLGAWGGHKFYERKFGLGVLYIFTLGLFFIGILVDIISLIDKPTEYPKKGATKTQR